MSRQKKLLLTAMLFVLGLLLCGCIAVSQAEAVGKHPAKAETEAAQLPEDEAPEPAPEPSPVPVATPEPIPELEFPDGTVHKAPERRLTLAELEHEDLETVISLLKQMPKLRTVNLGKEGTEKEPRDLGWDDIRKLQTTFPDVDFRYEFTLFGKQFTTLDEEMNFHHITMDDEGAAVREVLPCMTECKLLDMDFSGVSSRNMAKIRDAYPEMKVVWRVWFGTDCSVRTDVERILASNLNHKLSDENTGDLKYCTKVRFLDIGHNTMLKDFSFLEYMPDLEVAILCITGLEDLTPISGCTKMEYLEINTLYDGQGLDLSPLGSLVNLEHLDLCRLGAVQGWEALVNLTKLKRLWIGCNTWLPDGAREMLEEALPDTEINWTDNGGADGPWRMTKNYNGYNERYLLLRRQFEYSDYTNVCSSWYNDPLYFKEGEPHYHPYH